LSTRQSSAPTETGEKCDSGLQELVIDTNDPGRADFVISVGAGWNSDGSNGNNSNQGGTSDSDDPQGTDPSRNDLNKLVFTYSTTGGPLQHWDIEGTIRVAEVVQITRASIPQICSARHLIRPEIVDRVTDKMHYVYRHNDKNRVQTIINGMSIFMLKVPNMRMTPGNVTMLEEYVASSQEVCRVLS